MEAKISGCNRWLEVVKVDTSGDVLVRWPTGNVEWVEAEFVEETR